MATGACPPILVEVVRNGVIESVHRGHVAVATPDGKLLAGLGTPTLEVYARSVVKPFQVAAVLDVLAEVAPTEEPLAGPAIAVAAASHTGADDHVIEAAHLLATAGLDEEALACPAALPVDEAALAAAAGPTRIAFNCSGKHAAFLLAQVRLGEDAEHYLDPSSGVQRRVRERITADCGPPSGPGVDGCGAPAWRLSLLALARGFALLAGGDGDDRLQRVAGAMRAHPELVGGTGTDDAALMGADRRVVAKRGAEAVFGAGGHLASGVGVGVAVKISDGGSRAAGPVAAVLLRAFGFEVPDTVAAPAVLGGGGPQGSVRVTPEVSGLLAQVSTAT